MSGSSAMALCNSRALGVLTGMGWASPLWRVFGIDLEHCLQSGGEFKIIAAIEEPAVIVRILTHLRLPARAPPRSPARPLDLFQAGLILTTRAILQRG